MRYYLLVFILAFALCGNNSSLDINKSIDDIAKCLADKTLPITQLFTNALQGLKDGNYLVFAISMIQIYEDGKDAYIECFEVELRKIIQENDEFGKFILSFFKLNNKNEFLNNLLV